MISEKIKEFEQHHNCKVVYVTLAGSKLYGTDGENSDTDYKGIFIPNFMDVVLKKDPSNFTFTTGDDNSGNTVNDLDIQLYSIYKFNTLLNKGETGALDILFSMFREDTIVHIDCTYVTFMKENYDKFYSSNLHSFIGYCIGQSKKYNVKGERYVELKKFNNILHGKTSNYPSDDIENMCMYDLYDYVETTITTHNFKYIKMTDVNDGDGTSVKRYIEVLGKKFLGSVKVNYFMDKINSTLTNYGNRVKSNNKGVDWKALSHAVRVILEVEELLENNMITFPLKDADYLRSIKFQNEKLEDVLNFIDVKITEVDELMKASTLPKVNKKFMDDVILKFVKEQ